MNKNINLRNKTKKEIKGITLIALVVTIIVLLILAGIAINLTVGNNGLFSRAEKAANTWKEAELNEQKEMSDFEKVYDNTLKDLGLNGNGVENPLEKITGNEKDNTDTTDKEGNRIVVPAGFKVINPEATVDEGIVIEDVSANNEDTVGNQFVWIPCTIDGANGSIKYDRYAFSRENSTWKYSQTLILGTNGEYEKDADGSYKIQREDERDYYYHEAMSSEERTSVEQNGGYYIGRYEVGCDTERTESDKGNITAIAKVQDGKNIYNYITRDEANTIAERMYNGMSKLCSSYAWDTALMFIGEEWAVDSAGENYSGNGELKNTGLYVVKNIYDMGGNVYEWTTENITYLSYPCIARGGLSNQSSLDNPAAHRLYSGSEISYNYVGLRVNLYL